MHKNSFVMAVIAGLLFATTLGQSADGRISGTATDPTGAIIPGVEIEIVNEETGVWRKVITDDSGRYVVPLLHPGRYRLTATLPGFRTYVSDLLRGRIDLFSTDALIDMLARLGVRVRIVLSPSRQTRRIA
jgi:hypothetical protein